VAGGRDPAGDKAAADEDGPDRDLFPNALAQFIERYAKPKNRRWKDGAALLGLRPDLETGALLQVKGGIAAKWATRRVQELTKRDILDLLDGIVDRGSAISANRTFAALRKFFNWLIARDALTHSPCAGLKPPAPETSRDRLLSSDEIKWLWLASEKAGQPFGTIAQLLLATGQRKSEVGGMADSEIAERLWSLPAARTKNKRAHDVPLSDLALSLIERTKRIESEAGFLFTTTGLTPVSGFSKGKDELDEQMLKIAREERGETFKIAPWHLHDLRHSLKTWMQEARIEKDVRDAVQNHHTKDMDERYGHYTFADEKRAALDAWARHLTAIVTGKSAKVIKLRA
jgi:integrase